MLYFPNTYKKYIYVICLWVASLLVNLSFYFHVLNHCYKQAISQALVTGHLNIIDL